MFLIKKFGLMSKNGVKFLFTQDERSLELSELIICDAVDFCGAMQRIFRVKSALSRRLLRGSLGGGDRLVIK